MAGSAGETDGRISSGKGHTMDEQTDTQSRSELQRAECPVCGEGLAGAQKNICYCQRKAFNITPEQMRRWLEDRLQASIAARRSTKAALLKLDAEIATYRRLLADMTI